MKPMYSRATPPKWSKKKTKDSLVLVSEVADMHLSVPVMSSLFSRSNSRQAHSKAKCSPRSPIDDNNDNIDRIRSDKSHNVYISSPHDDDISGKKSRFVSEATTLPATNLVTGKTTLLRYKDNFEAFQTWKNGDALPACESPEALGAGVLRDGPAGWGWSQTSKTVRSANPAQSTNSDVNGFRYESFGGGFRSPRRESGVKTAPEEDSSFGDNIRSSISNTAYLRSSASIRRTQKAKQDQQLPKENAPAAEDVATPSARLDSHLKHIYTESTSQESNTDKTVPRIASGVKTEDLPLRLYPKGPLDFDALLRYAPAPEIKESETASIMNRRQPIQHENISVYVPVSNNKSGVAKKRLKSKQNQNENTDGQVSSGRPRHHLESAGLWQVQETDILYRMEPQQEQIRDTDVAVLASELVPLRIEQQGIIPAKSNPPKEKQIVTFPTAKMHAEEAMPINEDNMPSPVVPDTELPREDICFTVLSIPKTIDIGPSLNDTNFDKYQRESPRPGSKGGRPGSAGPNKVIVDKHNTGPKYVYLKPSSPMTRSRPSSTSGRPHVHEEKLDVENRGNIHVAYRPTKVAFAGTAGFRNAPKHSSQVSRRRYGNSSSAIKLVLHPPEVSGYPTVGHSTATDEGYDDDDDRSCKSAPSYSNKTPSSMHKQLQNNNQPVFLRKDIVSNRIAIGYHGMSEMQHKVFEDKIAIIRKPVVFDIPMIKTEHVKMMDRPEGRQDIHMSFQHRQNQNTGNDINIKSSVIEDGAGGNLEQLSDILATMPNDHLVEGDRFIESIVSSDEGRGISHESRSKSHRSGTQSSMERSNIDEIQGELSHRKHVLQVNTDVELQQTVSLSSTSMKSMSKAVDESTVVHTVDQLINNISPMNPMSPQTEVLGSLYAKLELTMDQTSARNITPVCFEESSASYGYYGVTPNEYREQRREERELKKLHDLELARAAESAAAAAAAAALDANLNSQEDAKYRVRNPNVAIKLSGKAITPRTVDLNLPIVDDRRTV